MGQSSNPPEPEHTLPIGQAMQLVELGKRFGVEPELLLAESGLTQSMLEDPNGRLPVSTMARLIERTRALTGEPGLGFYLALQKRITSYGYLGFAAMSASTLREAIELAVRFTPSVATGLSMRLEVDDRYAAMVFEGRSDFGSAQDVAVINLLVGLRKIGNDLTGADFEGWLEAAIPEPEYFPRFKHLVPELRFGQAHHRVVFDARGLDLPLKTPDRAALLLAKQQCEQAMLELGFDTGIVKRTRALIPTTGGFRSLTEVAPLLRVSPRTLKRKLAREGATFSELLEQARTERAKLLLRTGDLTLEEVADQLGYSSFPNFARAFRRWTGETPAAHRRAARARAADAARLGSLH